LFPSTGAADEAVDDGGPECGPLGNSHAILLVIYRFDFFFAFLALFFFFGIIFLTAFLAFFAANLTALTTRLVTDFFFAFLAISLNVWTSSL